MDNRMKSGGGRTFDEVLLETMEKPVGLWSKCPVVWLNMVALSVPDRQIDTLDLLVLRKDGWN